MSKRILNALTAAKWVRDSNSSGSLLGSATGIVVAVQRDGPTKDQDAGNALVAALNAEGLGARRGDASLKIGVAIKIQVAKKP